jgi:geranylgeranyl pyrophosphate synthase
MQTSADSVHQEVEHVMSALVDAGASSEERTIPATVKAARYHLAAGGHRVRAKLALHACDALQIKPVDAYRLAACVELLHNASLVHDDLQDEEKTRRGQPTVWAAFGRNVAICTGDLLLSAAHGALSEFSDPTLIPALLRRVHQSTAKVIHGQCDELSSKDRVLTEVSRYEQIVIGKSGALLSLPLELAFLAARKDQWRERVQQAAHAFGVGYQMVDDLDDLDKTVEVFGDLFDDLVGPIGLDGHAREAGVFGGRHGERLDVVTTGRKQPHHAGQGPGFVFQQDSDDVFHGIPLL